MREGDDRRKWGLKTLETGGERVEKAGATARDRGRARDLLTGSAVERFAACWSDAALGAASREADMSEGGRWIYEMDRGSAGRR